LCGTSTANINTDELAKRGIAFSNIVSRDKESVAEYFFMQLVSLARGAERGWAVGFLMV
jgi:phosphoglycerate dehydrogenase-like enzyme